MKALNKFPDLTYYMFLNKIIQPKLPKVVWCTIVKLVIESMSPTLLISILKELNPKVVLALQLSDSIYETVHYFPQYDEFFDLMANFVTYTLNDDLFLGCNKYSMNNVVRARLVDVNLCHFNEDEYLAECESFPGELGPIAHGEGIIFDRKQEEVYIGNHCLGSRTGFGRLYSSCGDLFFAGEFSNGLFVRGKEFSLYSDHEYHGEFDGYRQHGYGTLHTKNRCYVGNFKSGHIVGSGFGLEKIKNCAYIGLYKNNQKHGWGMEMTDTHNFVGIFDCGHRKHGMVYWKPRAEDPYFGPGIHTKCRWDTKTYQGCYAKTLWSNNVVTERYLKDNKTFGLAKVIFTTGIIFHTWYNKGEMDSWFLFSLSQKIKFKSGPVLL